MRMKLSSVLLSLSASLLATIAYADQMTVSIDGFGDPTGFSITETATLNLRVTELVAPLDEGTTTYASTYSGINVDSGETQDIGIVYLEMPEGSALPEGSVSSPVVGVVQRAGSWADPGYALSFPSTSVGGSSGDGDYTSGTLDLTLVRDAEVITGSTTYNVLDEDTIEVNEFTLTVNAGLSYQMSGATLLRDGNRFYGTLTNLSDGAGYDSLLFSIEFANIPDVDGDSIPDISDPSVEANGLVFTPDEYLYDEIVSWTVGLTTEWGRSQMLGNIYGKFHPDAIYSFELGWLLAPSGTAATGIYFYRYNAGGWMWTIESYGGFYWDYASQSWGSVF